MKVTQQASDKTSLSIVPIVHLLSGRFLGEEAMILFGRLSLR